eukprot:Gb_10625 [translate_table: standard]
MTTEEGKEGKTRDTESAGHKLALGHFQEAAGSQQRGYRRVSRYPEWEIGTRQNMRGQPGCSVQFQELCERQFQKAWTWRLQKVCIFALPGMGGVVSFPQNLDIALHALYVSRMESDYRGFVWPQDVALFCTDSVLSFPLRPVEWHNDLHLMVIRLHTCKENMGAAKINRSDACGPMLASLPREKEKLNECALSSAIALDSNMREESIHCRHCEGKLCFCESLLVLKCIAIVIFQFLRRLIVVVSGLLFLPFLGVDIVAAADVDVDADPEGREVGSAILVPTLSGLYSTPRDRNFSLSETKFTVKRGRIIRKKLFSSGRIFSPSPLKRKEKVGGRDAKMLPIIRICPLSF